MQPVVVQSGGSRRGGGVRRGNQPKRRPDAVISAFDWCDDAADDDGRPSFRSLKTRKVSKNADGGPHHHLQHQSITPPRLSDGTPPPPSPLPSGSGALAHCSF